ncbi:MAG TPA: hypothetical protein VGC28_01225 [Sphingomonas sp.]
MISWFVRTAPIRSAHGGLRHLSLFDVAFLAERPGRALGPWLIGIAPCSSLATAAAAQVADDDRSQF